MRIVLPLFLTFSLTTASECSCVRSPVTGNLKDSDVVFKGKVVEGKEVRTKEETTAGETVDCARYEFKFKVNNRFKGLGSKGPVTITTTGGDSHCGNKFTLGEGYLVYAYKEDLMLSLPHMDKKTEEYLSTKLCTRTRHADLRAFPELLVLNIL